MIKISCPYISRSLDALIHKYLQKLPCCDLEHLYRSCPHTWNGPFVRNLSTPFVVNSFGCMINDRNWNIEFLFHMHLMRSLSPSDHQISPHSFSSIEIIFFSSSPISPLPCSCSTPASNHLTSYLSPTTSGFGTPGIFTSLRFVWTDVSVQFRKPLSLTIWTIDGNPPVRMMLLVPIILRRAEILIGLYFRNRE